VLPSGIYVPADSSIQRPHELADIEIAVGYHSGSLFSTIRALEPFLAADQIKLRFGGFPYDRVDALLDGEVPAAAASGAATYLLEQHGCRRVLDTTFMAAFMFGASTDPVDVERYFQEREAITRYESVVQV
jgi:NitT/TauT family transport system substrate-binding protein